MRKRLATILAASGAVALTLSLSTTSVLAVTAKTWTVTPGGTLSGKSTKTVLTDTVTGAVLTCKTSTATGTAKSGSGLTNPLATISATTFGKCTGPAGLTFKVTTSAFPWDLNGTKYTASSGLTKGTITGIHAVLTGTNSSCTATVDGTSATADNGKVDATHKNSAPTKLNVVPTGGNLHAYNVSNCLGALNNGDATTYKATYTLTTGQTITSP